MNTHEFLAVRARVGSNESKSRAVGRERGDDVPCGVKFVRVYEKGRLHSRTHFAVRRHQIPEYRKYEHPLVVLVHFAPLADLTAKALVEGQRNSCALLVRTNPKIFLLIRGPRCADCAHHLEGNGLLAHIQTFIDVSQAVGLDRNLQDSMSPRESPATASSLCLSTRSRRDRDWGRRMCGRACP
jgi:hypothetical protein